MSAVYKRVRDFQEDVRAIVTVQMVMFSVMLFGGIGLMMDFGRAYSAHSQMQSFVDQVALAAAVELDGQNDAITRATTAAQAIAKSSAFIDGNGDFQLSSLTFMTQAPTDTSGAYSPTLAATYATTTPELARYVRAEAMSASVSLRLLNFAVDGASSMDSIDFVTAATATSRTVSCGGLTPIVMCNPFENSSTTSWQEAMEDGIGYRMKLTADITDGSKPSNYSDTNDLIRLGLLKNPVDLMDVRNTICSNSSYLPGVSTSSMTTEELRDICMLATVEAGLSCVNDRVAFKAAGPNEITTGLGVIFDMYDEPMNDILDTSLDFNFTHNFPASSGFPTSISRSSLFYPDRVPAHGRMTREHYNVHLDDLQAELDASTMPAFMKAPAQAAIDNERAAYPEDTSIPDASRQNYVFDRGERSEWGPAPERSCIEAENCGFYDTIHNASPGNNEIKSYAAALYRPELLQDIAAASGGTYPNWWDVPAGVVDASALAAGTTRYYQFYTDVERAETDLQDYGSIDGHTGRDSSGNPIIPQTAPANPYGYGAYGVKTGAQNFPGVYGASAIGDAERRVRRVTVVNCEAAQSYSTVTGDADAAYNDTYFGEIVDVVDLYMVTPPEVQSCLNPITNDPQSNYLCRNEEVTDVDLDVEVVDAASINAANFDARYYAVLVH